MEWKQECRSCHKESGHFDTDPECGSLLKQIHSCINWFIQNIFIECLGTVLHAGNKTTNSLLSLSYFPMVSVIIMKKFKSKCREPSSGDA